MRTELILQQAWFLNLSQQQQELIKQSLLLLDKARKDHYTFYDYSYIVMPAAKAYEGFIKDFLYDLGLISHSDLWGKRFRVGRSLNPELEKNPKTEKLSVYNDLKPLCHNKHFPENLWQTWKLCRNEIFHYFNRKFMVLTLDQAEKRLDMIIEAIGNSLTFCNPTRS